ncbi:MAG: malate dehydrogenase (quinone) [Gallionella sp.]
MKQNNTVDVLLVGAGVMSATLGTLLTQLDPSLKILMVERLAHVAHESSHSLNNAGTGHAGYCELNYTPQQADGTVAIDKALQINAAFEVSLQFWSYLVEQNVLPAPEKFINAVFHQSLVWGETDVAFLRLRFEKLSAHHLFEEMEYSEDAAVLREWMPLVMSQRTAGQAVAATQVKHGTDVDFGMLTRKLVQALKQADNFELKLNHQIDTLKQKTDGHWQVRMTDAHKNSSHTVHARCVFLGAGGGALPLLQKSKLPESQGYGGFPVSGQWLICKNPEVVKRHHSKVYGKAPTGAPPMSVPHLDARIIDGEAALLFGPFASITSKFLKQGSLFDLFGSLKGNNLKAMLAVGLNNFDLMRYLVGEALSTHAQRVAALRLFYPDAREEDWELASAGQRVQIIKQCDVKGGKLELGTEIVAASDGTLAALLGASPGASTSVQAMLEVLQRCFPERMASLEWQAKLKHMIPSYGESLDENVALLHEVRERTLRVLKLADK